MIASKQWKIPVFRVMAIPAAVLLTGAPGFAATYLTEQEARDIMFPGEDFTPVFLSLSPKEFKAISEKSGISSKLDRMSIWQTGSGGYFFVDQVIGKHEFITYAVGIGSDGGIRQVEILEYKEAYGYEVRQKRWKRQFTGKTSTSALRLNEDIKNVSGATLSCRHVTEGVKRIMVLYETVLNK